MARYRRHHGFGPSVYVGKVLYRPFVLFFLCGFLWEFFTGHFATAGAFLLLYAIFVPKRQKAKA